MGGVPAMPAIDTAERRRRIAVRHHLAPAQRGSDVAAVAADLVGLHASDPASVYLGAFARVAQLTHEDMARALYEERSLLKVLGMRRTMFATTPEIAGIITAAATRAIAGAERRRLIQMLTDAGVATDIEEWLADVEAATLTALEELGQATATELTKRVPGLRVQVEFGAGKKWAGKVGVSTRMLFLLAAEARVIRGRPRGSWLSSMYAWAPMDRWVSGGLVEPPTDAARAELVRRWLTAFGPGTQRDIQWWTGWTVAVVGQALADAGAVEVMLDQGRGFALADDLAPTPATEPWIALVPSLDTTTMAWKERDWYLGNHAARLFDTIGNAGPTIWDDGRIVGGWGMRRTGEIAYQLLEDVGRDREWAIQAEVFRLQDWIGASRVIPRFRTPLELELT
ncbi:winged helix DNA-binding domain-containing protein [soil metagenome]